MMELAESTCAISTAGIVVSAVRNRVCQDGGDGSTTNECALGPTSPTAPFVCQFSRAAPDHPSPATEPPSKPPSPPSPPPILPPLRPPRCNLHLRHSHRLRHCIRLSIHRSYSAATAHGASIVTVGKSETPLATGARRRLGGFQHRLVLSWHRLHRLWCACVAATAGAAAPCAATPAKIAISHTASVAIPRPTPTLLHHHRIHDPSTHTSAAKAPCAATSLPLPTPPASPIPYEWETCTEQNFHPNTTYRSAASTVLPTYEECVAYRDVHHPDAEIFNMRKFSTAAGNLFHRGEQQHDYELTRREGGEWRIMRNQGVANTLGGRTGDNNNEWSDSNIVADRAAVWPDVDRTRTTRFPTNWAT